MAEIIKKATWETSRIPKGRPSKYPWDEWLDGQARILTPGEDFDATIQSFRTLAHGVANRRGLRLRTAERQDGRFQIQAINPENGE